MFYIHSFNNYLLGPVLGPWNKIVNKAPVSKGNQTSEWAVGMLFEAVRRASNIFQGRLRVGSPEVMSELSPERRIGID